MLLTADRMVLHDSEGHMDRHHPLSSDHSVTGATHMWSGQVVLFIVGDFESRDCTTRDHV